MINGLKKVNSQQDFVIKVRGQPGFDSRRRYGFFSSLALTGPQNLLCNVY